MRSFKDSEGVEWNVAVNIGTVKRVRDQLQLDLLDIVDEKSGKPTDDGPPPFILRLSTDVILLCDVLYVLCKTQATERVVSDEQFGERMGGDALLKGQEALFEELTDFFRGLGRTELAMVIAKTGAFLKTAIAAASKRAEKLDVDGLAESVVGNSFTAAQGKLDSLLTSTR